MTATAPSSPESLQEERESVNASPPESPSHSTIGTISSGLFFNLVLPLILLAFGVAVVVMLGSAEPATRPPADTTRVGRLKALPSVRVEKLQSLEAANQRLQLVVDGTVVPYREARVAAEVAGRIVEKSDKCEAGAYVTAGEFLMKIDATDYELEVERLTRVKDQEYQALIEADQQMANTGRLIEVATKDVELQQNELNRQKELGRFTSRAEYDQAERSVLAAQQQLVNLENQLSLLKKQRVRLEASEKLAVTQLKAAEVNLERCTVVAPIDGVIVSEDADLNTFVARGSGLVTIDDTSKVEVATSLRMDQLYWVLDQPGGESNASQRGYVLPKTKAIIEYELAGREGIKYRWNGHLLSYDGIGVDPDTRTVPVRVVVDDPTQYVDANGEAHEVTGATALVRGMFVRVNLLIEPKSPLVVIPAKALQPGNRVFQFVADPSVLDVDPEMVEGQTLVDNSPADAPVSDPAETADSTASKFNPDIWEPGRVFVRHRVNPVDSLSISSELQQGGGSTAIADDEQRLWVCEVRDSSLTSDSFVVVSPLGDFDDLSLPVRAEKHSQEGQSGTVNSRASEASQTNSETTTLTSREDA